MNGLVERLKARYALPEGYYDDFDHGGNVDYPESLIMSILDSRHEGESVMRGLTVNDYSVIPDATLDEAAARITALEAENERMKAALQSILNVTVERHFNIWEGSDRCKSIARQALGGHHDAD